MVLVHVINISIISIEILIFWPSLISVLISSFSKHSMCYRRSSPCHLSCFLCFLSASPQKENVKAQKGKQNKQTKNTGDES